MSEFKFPRTPHLLQLGKGVTDDDIVLSEKEFKRFFETDGEIIIEEKIDGANLGLFFDEDWKPVFQNRGKVVTHLSSKQFSALNLWFEENAAVLREILGQDYVIYGEWVVARHSIPYTSLPSRFIAFDVFHIKNKQFLSSACRDAILESSSIPVVPNLFRGQSVSKEELLNLVKTAQSEYYNGPVEGVYVRIDMREGKYNLKRGKVVRADFTQSIDVHWSRQKYVKNGFAF